MNDEEYIATFQGSAKDVIQRLYELLIIYWELQYKINPEFQQSNKTITPRDIARRYAKTMIKKYEDDPDRIISELATRLNQGGFPVTWFKADDVYVLQVGYTEINELLESTEKLKVINDKME